MEETPPPTLAGGPVEWTRVVALAPAPSADAAVAGASLSAALQKEFEARDWFAIVQHDPYLALAELALRERAQTARAAWGLQRMEGLALMVVEPEHWPAHVLADLFEASRRWLPAAAIWLARGDRIEPAGDVAPPATVGRRLATTSATPRPRSDDLERTVASPRASISTISRNGHGGSGASDASGDDPCAADRLSRAEIDMLLHQGPIEGEVHDGDLHGGEQEARS